MWARRAVKDRGWPREMLDEQRREMLYLAPRGWEEEGSDVMVKPNGATSHR